MVEKATKKVTENNPSFPRGFRYLIDVPMRKGIEKRV